MPSAEAGFGIFSFLAFLPLSLISPDPKRLVFFSFLVFGFYSFTLLKKRGGGSSGWGSLSRPFSVS
jgi:hypothetical protein